MKWGLVKKIVFGIIGVSVVTYGCSAFFIFYLKDLIAPGMSDWSYISIILLLGIIWSGILGWLGAAWLIKPLLKLAAAANEAATGNLRIDIPEHPSDDEIRLLSQSFKKMIAGLRQMITDISGNASFTHQHAGSLSGGMDQAARQIERIAVVTDTISKGAAQQAAIALDTRSAVTSIRQSAAEIDGKAVQSQTTAHEMLETIAGSGQIVRSLVEGMMELAKSNRESIGMVTELHESAKQIRSISQVVGGIAEQTHLLALNASIEAARAGETGQGFAVVAGEIRKLAEESASAVKHINQLIAGMEAGVAGVVKATTAQERLASRESGKGDAAREAWQRIDGAVRETAYAVEDIAAHISEQMRQVEQALEQTRQVEDIAHQISQDIRQAAASAQEQTAVMQELASSSEMLRTQADALNAKVNVFRI